MVLEDDFLELLYWRFESVFDLDLDLSSVCRVKFLEGLVYI